MIVFILPDIVAENSPLSFSANSRLIFVIDVPASVAAALRARSASILSASMTA